MRRDGEAKGTGRRGSALAPRAFDPAPGPAFRRPRRAGFGALPEESCPRSARGVRIGTSFIDRKVISSDICSTATFGRFLLSVVRLGPAAVQPIVWIGGAGGVVRVRVPEQAARILLGSDLLAPAGHGVGRA